MVNGLTRSPLASQHIAKTRQHLVLTHAQTRRAVHVDRQHARAVPSLQVSATSSNGNGGGGTQDSNSNKNNNSSSYIAGTSECNNHALPTRSRFLVKFFDPMDPEHVIDIDASSDAQQSPPSPPPPASAASLATATSTAASKDVVMQKMLVQQLEAERGRVMQLQQYEGMYRESRVSSEQLRVEVASLQDLVSRKDAELARSYSAMSEGAAERSTLRQQFTTSQDSLVRLTAQLDEARTMVLQLRALLPTSKSAVPVALGASGTSNVSSAASSGSNGRSPAQVIAQMKEGGGPALLTSPSSMSSDAKQDKQHEDGAALAAAGVASGVVAAAATGAVLPHPHHPQRDVLSVAVRTVYSALSAAVAAQAGHEHGV